MSALCKLGLEPKFTKNQKQTNKQKQHKASKAEKQNRDQSVSEDKVLVLCGIYYLRSKKSHAWTETTHQVHCLGKSMAPESESIWVS